MVWLAGACDAGAVHPRSHSTVSTLPQRTHPRRISPSLPNTCAQRSWPDRYTGDRSRSRPPAMAPHFRSYKQIPMIRHHVQSLKLTLQGHRCFVPWFFQACFNRTCPHWLPILWTPDRVNVQVVYAARVCARPLRLVYRIIVSCWIPVSYLQRTGEHQFLHPAGEAGGPLAACLWQPCTCNIDLKGFNATDGICCRGIETSNRGNE